MTDLFCPDILMYGLYYFAILAILYLAGYCIDYLLSKGSGFSFERNKRILFYGLTSVVPVFALFVTKGRSILILALFLLPVIIRYNKKKTDQVQTLDWLSRENISRIIVCFALAVSSFLFTYWLFYIYTEGNIFCDQYFYANVSANLLDNRIESTSLIGGPSLNPYHYGDLWLTALGISLFRANAVHILICISYSIFLYLTLSASVCTIGKIFPSCSSLTLVLFSSGFLFFTPFVSFFYPWTSTIGVSKLLVLSFFFWVSAGHILDKDYESAVLAALLSVPFYSTAAPGVLVFSFLLGWWTNSKRGVLKKCVNVSSISSLFVFIGYLAFYINCQSFPDEEMSIVHPGNIWVNALLFTVKRSLRIIILMAPSFIACLLIQKKKRQYLPQDYIILTIILLAAFCISNIVAGVIRNFHIDGGQIATNFYVTAGWIFIYISFLSASRLLLVKTDTTKIRGLCLAGCISLLYIVYYFSTPHFNFSIKKTGLDEKEAYGILKKEFETRKDINFGYFRNYYIEENHNTQKSRSYMFFPMERIGLIKSDGRYFAHCLSALDFPSDILPIWDDHKNTGLYHYRATHPEESEAACVVKFIYDSGIDYIIVESGASLPSFLHGAVKSICSYGGNTCYSVNQLKCL